MTPVACDLALSTQEILANILSFNVYQPAPPEQWAGHRPLATHVPSYTDAPWPYLLVNKFWHATTLKSPSLWSTFVLVTDPNSNVTHAQVRHLPSMLKTHLRLSKASPLTIVICWSSAPTRSPAGNPIDEDALVPLSQLTELVQKAAELESESDKARRWSAMYIYGFTITPPSFVNSYPINFAFKLSAMTGLTHLHVDGHTAAGARQVIITPTPSLRKLSIGGSVDFAVQHEENEKASERRFLPNLRSLSLTSMCRDVYQKVLSVFEVAANIESLDLLFVDRGPDGMITSQAEIPTPKITLPNLRRLSIDANINVSFPTLERFTLPSLVNLEVGGVEMREENLPILERLLQLHPQAQLKLSLPVAHYSDSTFRGHLGVFLRSILRTRTLCLQSRGNDSGTNALLNDLIGELKPVSSQILPRLTLLELIMPSTEFYDAEGDLSIETLKSLVLACRKRYSEVFKLNLLISNRNIRLLRARREALKLDFGRILEMLQEDSEIQSCNSQKFTFTFEVGEA